MDFAIIAAGKGSRMDSEGASVPKPLVKIGGVPMIKRIIDAFVSCGATTISIIINEDMPDVREYLNSLDTKATLNVIAKNTQGSMHSFLELKQFITDECFCLSTVDAVFAPHDFSNYINSFSTHTEIDGYMAVTPFIDDEIPLYVTTGNDGVITGFHDQSTPGAELVSGGIYILRHRAIDVLDECMRQGITDMRDYQRQLLSHGLRLHAHSFNVIVDVDHVHDIKTANDFINSTKQPTWQI